MREKQMIERNIKRSKRAEPNSSGKIRKVDNYKLALGTGSNWVDLDSGVMYMIQEYYDAMHDPKVPQEQKPKKIRLVDYKTGKDIGWKEPEIVAQLMKDPEPDPRY